MLLPKHFRKETVLILLRQRFLCSAEVLLNALPLCLIFLIFCAFKRERIGVYRQIWEKDKKVISCRSLREKQGHQIQWKNKETRWLVFLFFPILFWDGFCRKICQSQQVMWFSTSLKKPQEVKTAGQMYFWKIKSFWSTQ